MSFNENYINIKNGIADAARRAGRDPGDVKLICVSKGHTVEEVREAIDCGAVIFGENRVDELIEKHDNVISGTEWHMIGQLQTNKVKKLIGKVAMIHSVDRLALACEIDRRSRAAGLMTDVLIELDYSSKEGRGGVDEEGGMELMRAILAMPGIRLRGVMTVAPLGLDDEETRACFKRVRLMFDRMKAEAGSEFDTLSMGMSHDYMMAIEEGATVVRIGTALFGPIKK